MRLSLQDSREFDHDHSWALGIYYYGWDESAIDMNFGARCLSITWDRKRPAAQRPAERIWRFMTDPVWGFGVYRDTDKIWTFQFGPWLHEFGTVPPERRKG